MIEFCMLASGSSGNAVYVGTEKTKILIDAGLSGKRIAAALASIGVNAAELDALLLSHDHIDHICGAGIMARRYKLAVFATQPTWQAAKKRMGTIAAAQCCYLPNCGSISFADLEVETIPLPHDAADPVGFIFRSPQHTVALVTDLGHITPYIRQRVQDMDCLIVEANHDEEMLLNGQYPWPLKKRILGDKGHLSNKTVAEFLSQVVGPKTQQVVLAHLSEHNNTPQLAFSAVCSSLKKSGHLRPEKKLKVSVAARHTPSCYLRLA